MNSGIETTYWNYQACTFIEIIPKTHSQVYTQNILQTDAFTHRHFYTQTPFTHRHFYTQKLLHTDAFTHRRLSTRSFTHRRFYTQRPLHTNAFTHRCVYTQTLLHADAFTHRRFYTQTFLHTDAHMCAIITIKIAIVASAFDDRPSFLAKELRRQFYRNF